MNKFENTISQSNSTKGLSTSHGRIKWVKDFVTTSYKP